MKTTETTTAAGSSIPVSPSLSVPTQEGPSVSGPAEGMTDANILPRKHFVHVYGVVRVKVDVDARDHQEAMAAAEQLVFGKGFGVRLVPEASGIVDASYADEIVGYLVDEADDPDYENSQFYGPFAESRLSDVQESPPIAGSLEPSVVTLTFRPQAWIRDYAVSVDASGPTDWSVRRSLILQRFPTKADWRARADERDNLRFEGTAAPWIRNWPGPFEVEIAESENVWGACDEL